MISVSPSASTHWKRLVGVGMLVGAVWALSACGKHVEKTEDIRPVRALTLTAASTADTREFAAEIRPRIETRQGFRVAGKISTRTAEVGMRVKRGQVLMVLDAQDYQLAQAQAKAALLAARSNRDLAQADAHRYQELREKNFVSPAVLEAKQTAARAAQSSYEQAEAATHVQENQSSYTRLVAEVDGVITGIDAEIGQVVAAGTPVVRIAQEGAARDLEAVLSVPEDQLAAFKAARAFEVVLWSDRQQAIPAKLRELSLSADPVTRTFLAKLTLEQPAQTVHIGMTAIVRVRSASTRSGYRLPFSALFQEKEKSHVWIVEGNAAKLIPVVVEATEDQDVWIGQGLKAGMVVVTAGVHQLREGQKVSILGAPAADAEPAAAQAAKTGGRS